MECHSLGREKAVYLVLTMLYLVLGMC